MREKTPELAREFAGMTAVVTGAARGIGQAIAEALYERGAQLILVDCNGRAVSAVADVMREAGRPPIHCVTADLALPQVAEMLARELTVFSPTIDILVNNAGIEADIPFGRITAEAFDRMIAVNLRAPLLVSQALAPLFPPGGGAIVNVSSIHAGFAFPHAIPYACSKAGLIALTRNLALELAPRKIRVNAVCPGYIDTPMWEEWLRTAPDPEALAGQIAALHPLGRRGLPEDVAAAVVSLAGPGSAWITGTHLVVDGGLTIRTHP
jgi:NAD(P)-dependent dehydrogenase (short-subunit alcohol dehydrogenase family)